MAIKLSYVNVCKEIVADLLTKLGIEAETSIRANDEMIFVEIEGGNSKDLIGYRGDTLASLQTILSMLLSKQVSERIYVAVDVNGYRDHREQALTAMAKRAAEEVMLSLKPITLDSMLPYERRIVHLVLQGFPEVMSESEGEEPDRKIVIKPTV